MVLRVARLEQVQLCHTALDHLQPPYLHASLVMANIVHDRVQSSQQIPWVVANANIHSDADQFQLC